MRPNLIIALSCAHRLGQLFFSSTNCAFIFRCLNTESDLDFERERAAENRRRFEGALSAMHELGRANQTLQVFLRNFFGAVA